MKLRTQILISFLLLFSSILQAQVNLTMQVNMSQQVELGKFNPQTEFVDVAGTFNGWGGDVDRLSDPDGDLVYEVVLTGLADGDQIAYKFRLNGQWDGREEFPGAGNDRTYTVGSADALIDHWYNNETPPDVPPEADLLSNLRELYEEGMITFRDLSSGDISSWEWEFEGGTPATSTAQNPVVRYDEPGNYNVTLTVSNGDQSSHTTLDNYIKVLARDTENIPWWNEAVFYEIFVRSFYDSDGDGVGDFQGIIEKLDYLNDGDPNTTDDLGITGIWLMPIHESPSYHGYDVIDYESINPDYGTMDDFKEFLAEAHKRGIRVIIDYVMNHTSERHEWFEEAATNRNSDKRDWFRWSSTDPGYNGIWGNNVWHQKSTGFYYGLFSPVMPDVNYRNPDVKAAIFESADFWLEEIGIDGFRLDAVKFLVEDGQRAEDLQETYDVWAEFNAHYKATKPDAFTVGEAWAGTNSVINYVRDNRIDYCFEFDLAGNILNAVNNGYAADLANQIQYVYSIYPHLQYGTFLTNHDQDRLMNVVGSDESKVKLAAAINLTLPGVPYIYYGEEIGMIGAKPDEDIRRPMQWANAINGGFSDARPWRPTHGSYPRYNVQSESADPTSMLSWYRDLIQLRSREKAMQVGTYEAVSTSNNNVLAYLRQYEEETILVLHNTSANVAANLSIDLNGEGLSNASFWLEDMLGATNAIPADLKRDQTISDITLSGRSTKIFKFSQTTSTTNLAQNTAFKLFPNPVTSDLSVSIIDAEREELPYSIIGVDGRIIKTGFITEVTTVINTSDLDSGLYYLSLKGRSQSFVKL